MATEVKQAAVPSEQKSAEEKIVETTRRFWQRNSKYILWTLTVLILVGGGYLIYQKFFVADAEKKAAEAMWKAEDYFRMDSVRLALNGDGPNAGFLRVISRYGGTKSGNLAKFYAGSCYLQLGDYNNAIKYLKDFSTGQIQVKLRANGLLGDAYSELGKKQEAIDYYKKAGTMIDKDEINSPEYLYRAAMLYQELGKNKEAIDLLKQVKERYPNFQKSFEVEKYLGKLGETR